MLKKIVYLFLIIFMALTASYIFIGTGAGGLLIFLFYIISVAAILGIYYFMFCTKNAKHKPNPAPPTVKFLYIMLGIALVSRLAAAPVIEGHPIDISCFKAWASIAAKNLPGFYNNDMFVDYPPVYIYILFFMAKIANLFGFINIQWAYTLVIKLPPMLADIVTAFFIFKISKGKLSDKWALLLAGIYAFNPVVILNSALWGQVDSFFTMLIAAALLLIVYDKLQWSAVLYSLAILMKPQGIIFLPVLFFELVKRKSIKGFIMPFLYFSISSLLILLPFSFTQHPLWIFRLFVDTTSGYEGASINAFNFFALLGANWKDDSATLFIFSYNVWGFVFIVLTTLFAWFLYIKGKSRELPLIASIILITGVFVLSSKMHERYLYPAMALSIIAFIFNKDKRLLWFYAGSTVTGFINTYAVFKLSLDSVYWVPANDWILRLTSLANLLILFYIVKISIDLIVRNTTFEMQETQENKFKPTKKARKN